MRLAEPTAVKGTAFLELMTGEKAGKRHAVVADRSIMGRHPDCQIVLDAGSVSRQHVQICASTTVTCWKT
ncbi:MAG: FHA domain-containing protein [Pirellulales bacterium]